MASGLAVGRAPIQPLEGGAPVSDPLVQAMTLTALVIGFAVTAVLRALSCGVYRARLARAGSTGERILSLDLLTLVLIGLLAVAAGEDQRSYALDAALGLALLSFVATLAAARYYENRKPLS